MFYGAITRSLDASLARLGLDHVRYFFQLHNTLGRTDFRGTLTIDQIMDAVVPAFDKLRDSGKVRFSWFLRQKAKPMMFTSWFSCGVFSQRAGVFYNLLVPSAGEPIAANYPSDDYKLLLETAKDHGVGGDWAFAFLAGGALSGSVARHPLGMRDVYANRV